jgi:hypothetical protein
MLSQQNLFDQINLQIVINFLFGFFDVLDPSFMAYKLFKFLNIFVSLAF